MSIQSHFFYHQANLTILHLVRYQFNGLCFEFYLCVATGSKKFFRREGAVVAGCKKGVAEICAY